MRIDEINKRSVEKFLKGVRSSNMEDSILIGMSSMEQYPLRDSIERSIKLTEIMLNLCEDRYQHSRQSEGMEKALPRTKTEASSCIQMDFSKHNADLEALSALFYRYCSSFEFSIENLAQAAHVVPQQLRRRLNTGLGLLVDELQRMEMDSNRKSHMSDRNIPLQEYAALVGVDNLIRRLNSLHDTLTPGEMISIEGMGGIGKTALAREFVGQSAIQDAYYEILWVSARQPLATPTDGITQDTTLDEITLRIARQMGQDHLAGKPPEERLLGIQSALRYEKYLLVVDNLETVADYSQLVPALAKYCGAAKIILTTRESLREFPFVRVLQVPELAKPVAAQLLQSEVNRRGRDHLISEENLEKVYDLIGGLPLAIKLTAAQIHLNPIELIIEEFQKARNGAEEIYRFLYWKSWSCLGDEARKLLLTFLATDPEGEDSSFLQVASGLSSKIFLSALQELDNFSLLETRWEQQIPKYRIHRLTTTFLQTDVLKHWGQ